MFVRSSRIITVYWIRRQKRIRFYFAQAYLFTFNRLSCDLLSFNYIHAYCMMDSFECCYTRTQTLAAYLLTSFQSSHFKSHHSSGPPRTPYILAQTTSTSRRAAKITIIIREFVLCKKRKEDSRKKILETVRITYEKLIFQFAWVWICCVYNWWAQCVRTYILLYA